MQPSSDTIFQQDNATILGAAAVTITAHFVAINAEIYGTGWFGFGLVWSGLITIGF